MRKLVYVIVLALLFLVPVKRLDVSKLEPVQTVAIYTEPGFVILKTDTGNTGRGGSVSEAIKNLEETTPGVIYLDTAEYLLVAKDAEDYAQALEAYLSPSVRVSSWDRDGSVQRAAKYLRIRKDLPKLRDWKPAAQK